jgi:hypothetical protein
MGDERVSMDPATAPIRFTRHAVARYADRVRELAEEEAFDELRRLAKGAAVRPDPPNWVTDVHDVDCWLWLIADGSIVCPLSFKSDTSVLLAVSVLTRGSLSSDDRYHRNRRRAVVKAGKRAAKRAVRGPRPRRPPDSSDQEHAA